MKDKLIDTFRGLTRNEYMVLAFTVAAFFSVYLQGAMILLLPLYVLVTRQTKLFLPKAKSSYFLLAFAVSAAISTFFFSQTGYLFGFVLETYYVKLLSIGIIILCFDIFFFINTITKRAFHLSLYLATFLSVVVVGIGAIQMALGLYPDPVNRPGRVASLFMNENYFGMMLEFTILITLFLFFKSHSKKEKIFFFSIFLINLTGLWLSQCRMAFLIAGLSLLIFLFFYSKKFSYFFFVLLCISAVLILIFPDLLPRTDTILSTVDFRLGIWKNAWEGFLELPILGRGYFAYCAVWTKSDNLLYSALHAHNLYLELLLNFGVIGTFIISLYSFFQCKASLSKGKHNRYNTALIVGTVMAILVHSVMDTTLFWPQTGYFAVLLLVCPHVYTQGE